MKRKNYPTPKRVEDLLDNHGHLSLHLTDFWGNLGKGEFQGHLQEILKYGLIPWDRAKGLSKRTGGKVIINVPNFVSDPTRINAFEFDRDDSRAKKRLKLHLTSPSGLPAIIFKKGNSGPTEKEGFYHSRIQPNKILAIILHKIGRNEVAEFISKLEQYGKPIYDYRGKRIWPI